MGENYGCVSRIWGQKFVVKISPLIDKQSKSRRTINSPFRLKFHCMFKEGQDEQTREPTLTA
ncbi:hypothetical protein DFP77_107166 [Marinomonas foliarum]|uniref:Uncharacterized protein n=1 Tax=Marinomonas foliarum TaxID=491950 RepID=A0A369AFL1_9GAMM|nr:hypothetical protein DFP77_107166 [Marinomonas foliarum]